MVDVLQLVDEDLSSIVFDFNDTTGVNNSAYAAGLKTTFGVGGTFMLNAPEVQFMDFQPSNVPGGFTTLARATIATSSWRQRCYSDTYDNLVAGIGGMNNVLRQGGILKWQPNGSTVPKYIDLLPSGATAVFDGREVELLQAVTMFDTPPGVTVVVRRQPYLRGAELNPAVNVITNPTMILDLNADGIPDGWTSAAGTHSIVAADEAYQNSHTAAVDLLRSNTSAASNGQTWTGSIMFRQISGLGTFRLITEALNGGGTVVQSATATALATNTGWIALRATLAITDATTATVRLTLKQQTASGTTVGQFRNAQLEQNTGASAFRVKSMAVPMEPASTTAGSGPKVFPFYVHGDAQAPVVLTATMDSGSAIQKVTFARRSQRRALPDYINSTRYAQAEATGNGWTVTLGTDTTGVADANASPGSGTSVAQVASGGASSTNLKRVRITRTTKLDSLRGTFRVYARVKASAESIWKIGVRWAPSLADPAPNSNDVATHDLSTNGVPAVFGYVIKDLGTISLPTETTVTLAGLALELWAQRESGSGTLNIDYLSFLPDDERVGSLVVAGGSSETWLGKNLTTPPYKLTADATWIAGAVSGNSLRLNVTNEGGGTPTNTGLTWPTGRNRITFKWNKQGILTCKFRVVNVTGGGGSGSEVAAFTIGTPGTFNGAGSRTVEFDTTGGQVYQAQAVVTARTSGYIDIREMEHEFVASVASGEKLRGDPGSVPSRYATEKLDSSSQVIQSVSCEGEVPMWCEPGLNLVAIQATDIPLQGYAEGESKLTRVLTVQANYAPRYHA